MDKKDYKSVKVSTVKHYIIYNGHVGHQKQNDIAYKRGLRSGV